MMHRMTRRPIQDRAIRHILPIMNKHRPQLHKKEQRQIAELLQWENERKHMVRHTLQPPINRMERHARIRSRHNPFMVRFMQTLINQRVMQTAMDEINTEIRKQQEERELQVIVISEWFIGEGIVEFGVPPYFGEEEGGGEDGDEGHGVDGLADLHPYLVFEEFGVFEGCFVEDEDVGEGGDDEVDCCAGDPGGIVLDGGRRDGGRGVPCDET